MAFTRPLPEIVSANERLVMIVGNYGSGKTEIAVNLAVHLAEQGRQVQIADLDIVNPYFRSREARRVMEEHDIRVVVPPGTQAFADLPIILPEIRGMLTPKDDVLTLFDVGGDDVGAKALASFRTTIGDGPYELWQVVNARRPFTGDVEGCRAMQADLETASRLQVTGFLSNAHLIEHTTPETVVEGWRLTEQVAEAAGRPVRGVAVMREIADDPAIEEITAPLLVMERRMLPPWMLKRDEGEPSPDDERLPAARPIPIGKPRPIEMPRPRRHES